VHELGLPTVPGLVAELERGSLPRLSTPGHTAVSSSMASSSADHLFGATGGSSLTALMGALEMGGASTKEWSGAATGEEKEEHDRLRWEEQKLGEQLSETMLNGLILRQIQSRLEGGVRKLLERQGKQDVQVREVMKELQTVEAEAGKSGQEAREAEAAVREEKASLTLRRQLWEAKRRMLKSMATPSKERLKALDQASSQKMDRGAVRLKQESTKHAHEQLKSVQQRQAQWEEHLRAQHLPALLALCPGGAAKSHHKHKKRPSGEEEAAAEAAKQMLLPDAKGRGDAEGASKASNVLRTALKAVDMENKQKEEEPTSEAGAWLAKERAVHAQKREAAIAGVMVQSFAQAQAQGALQKQEKDSAALEETFEMIKRTTGISFEDPDAIIQTITNAAHGKERLHTNAKVKEDQLQQLTEDVKRYAAELEHCQFFSDSSLDSLDKIDADIKEAAARVSTSKEAHNEAKKVSLLAIQGITLLSQKLGMGTMREETFDTLLSSIPVTLLQMLADASAPSQTPTPFLPPLGGSPAPSEESNDASPPAPEPEPTPPRPTMRGRRNSAVAMTAPPIGPSPIPGMPVLSPFPGSVPPEAAEPAEDPRQHNFRLLPTPLSQHDEDDEDEDDPALAFPRRTFIEDDSPFNAKRSLQSALPERATPSPAPSRNGRRSTSKKQLKMNKH